MKIDQFVPDYQAKKQAELAALTPAQRAARRQRQDAGSAQARLALGCFCYWLSDRRNLLTTLPPASDLCGTATEMTIYTAEHVVTVRGENLNWLAWDMKYQRIDDLRVSKSPAKTADAPKWKVTAITAQSRDELL